MCMPPQKISESTSYARWKGVMRERFSSSGLNFGTLFVRNGFRASSTKTLPLCFTSLECHLDKQVGWLIATVIFVLSFMSVVWCLMPEIVLFSMFFRKLWEIQ